MIEQTQLVKRLAFRKALVEQGYLFSLFGFFTLLFFTHSLIASLLMLGASGVVFHLNKEKTHLGTWTFPWFFSGTLLLFSSLTETSSFFEFFLLVVFFFFSFSFPFWSEYNPFRVVVKEKDITEWFQECLPVLIALYPHETRYQLYFSWEIKHFGQFFGLKGWTGQDENHVDFSTDVTSSLLTKWLRIDKSVPTVREERHQSLGIIKREYRPSAHEKLKHLKHSTT